MIHRSASIALLTLVAAIGTGCSCSERVYVQNDTEEMLHVQIQLPKPDVPWACGCKCVYETLVGPGALWNSARPGSPYQMDYPFQAYSDCAVVRARVGVSGPWALFTMCGEQVDASGNDPVTIKVVKGSNAGLDATAATEGGTAIPVSAQTVDE